MGCRLPERVMQSGVQVQTFCSPESHNALPGFLMRMSCHVGMARITRTTFAMCLAALLLSQCLLETSARSLPAGRALQQLSSVTQPLVGGCFLSPFGSYPGSYTVSLSCCPRYFSHIAMSPEAWLSQVHGECCSTRVGEQSCVLQEEPSCPTPTIITTIITTTMGTMVMAMATVAATTITTTIITTMTATAAVLSQA